METSLKPGFAQIFSCCAKFGGGGGGGGGRCGAAAPLALPAPYAYDKFRAFCGMLPSHVLNVLYYHGRRRWRILLPRV